jgi:hypothetical protein
MPEQQSRPAIREPIAEELFGPDVIFDGRLCRDTRGPNSEAERSRYETEGSDKMPDNGNNSASPTLTPPLSQPSSPGIPPWLKPLQLGLLCETPNGVIELPSLRLGTHLENQVRDFCHKATLDYWATHRLDYLNFPLPPNVIVRPIINNDGFTFNTPAVLHLGKFDAGAILSLKPALPIEKSRLTGGGFWGGYHVSPRFNIELDGSVGQTSTDPYGRKIAPQTDLGLHPFIRGKF